MLLRERVAIGDVGILHSVQQHVHAADAKHRVVEVEAMKHAVMEVLLLLRVEQLPWMPLAQVFTGCDQKAGCAAGRIADHVVRLRRRQLDHQPDDVPWRAELPVLTCARDLAEHVFIHVALGIAVLHWHGIEQIHDFRQQRRPSES